jgi:glutamate racemase
LVLGCTHYPLLADLLRRVAGEGVRVVDSATAVADSVARDLAEMKLLRPDSNGGSQHLCVTDIGAPFQRLSHSILGPGAKLEWVEV